MLSTLFNHTKFLGYLSKCSDACIQVLGFMSGRYLYPYTRLSFGHYRIVETGYVDAFIEQTCGNILREFGIVKHYSTNGRFGRFDIKTVIFHPFHKIFGVGMEYILQIVGGINHFKHFDACCSHHRRNGI